MNSAITALRRFLLDESSPTFLEYGLLMLVIALAVIASAVLFGTAVTDMFQQAANAPSSP